MSDDEARRRAGASAPEEPPWAAGAQNRQEEMQPTLSDEEIEIVCGYGKIKEFEDGAILWEVADQGAPFYLVLDGALEILSHDERGDEHAIVVHERGGFGGEIATMAGRGALVAGRAKGALKAAVLQTREIRDLLALEAELGEKILLSFILRRMSLITARFGEVALYGEVSQPETAGLREFLSRNGIPFRLIDPASEDDAQARQRLSLDDETPPVFVCGEQRLRKPTLKEVADALGMSASIDDGQLFDVAVIGAGPGGLAAAVYAASEGLSVVAIEKCAVGGQAGSSSRIENYLGFPTGISGQALTGRGFLQAQKFGAEFVIARECLKLATGEDEHVLHFEDDESLRARAVIVATGADYRAPPIDGLAEFERSSVHYGASHIQAMLCRDKDVAIIGGGNSAGQAAVYLSRRARSVKLLIRSGDLSHSMSNYLIRRIERSANIELMAHTEAKRIEGEGGAMERLIVFDNRDGDEQSAEERPLDVAQLFIFIGAAPASAFLCPTIALDDKGFIHTGEALTDEMLKEANWPVDRRPYLNETSAPRVFAVGDIRAGSVKRVASAVGEGSVTVQFVHKSLNDG